MLKKYEGEKGHVEVTKRIEKEKSTDSVKAMIDKALQDLEYFKSSNILVLPEEDSLGFTKAIIEKNDLNTMKWIFESS